MTTPVAPDLPDAMFELPAVIRDDEENRDLVTVYEVLLQRTRQELAAHGCNTLDYMLLERDLQNFIVMKWRERMPAGPNARAVGGFEHSTAHKDFNLMWLTQHKELSGRLSAKSSDDVRNGIVGLVSEALNNVFTTMHPDVANPLRQRIGTEFTNVGL